jgi:hypothetical protein
MLRASQRTRANTDFLTRRTAELRQLQTEPRTGPFSAAGIPLEREMTPPGLRSPNRAARWMSLPPCGCALTLNPCKRTVSKLQPILKATLKGPILSEAGLYTYEPKELIKLLRFS